MISSQPGRDARRPRHSERGTVLVIVLLLLAVLAILGSAAMTMATLELGMAANFQHQQRAFEAAEFGIQQALRAPDRSTAYTQTHPKQVPASGPAPSMPGSTTDRYEYRLYHDSSAGHDAVPDAAAVGAGVAALHFIVESTGHSSRGAEDLHTQSFYVLVPEECVAGGPGCAPLASFPPIPSGWSQRDAE